MRTRAAQIACLWWIVGTAPFNAHTRNADGAPVLPWVRRVHGTGFGAAYQEAGFGQQYWTCLYWSLTTLVKVPWVQPASVAEKVVTAVALVLGALFYAFLISEITQVRAAGGLGMRTDPSDDLC